MNNMEQYDLEMQEQKINWREIFEKYFAYWKWILSSLIVVSSIGFFYLRMQPHVYQSNATLLIVDQARSGGMNEFSMLRQLDLVSPIGAAAYMTMVNNENEVIKSTALMKRVVWQLGLHTSYTKNRFLRPVELYKESPYVVKIDSMSLIRLNSGLVFQLIPEKGKLVVKGNYNKNDFEFVLNTLPAIINTPAGPVSIAVALGETIPKETITVSIYNPASVARHINKNVLKTEVSKQVDVIFISTKTNNSELGKDLLYTLVSIYNQDAVEQINRSANNTANFIDNRLGLIENELSDVEQNVESYKELNQITDMSNDAQMFLQKNTKYEQQMLEVETQLSLIKFIEEFISQRSNSYALIPNLGLLDVGLVAVVNSYNELLMTRERIANSSSEENPSLRKIELQLNASRDAIRNSVAQSKKGVEIKRNDIFKQNYVALGKLKSLPRQEREFIEIKRQQQVKESLYLFLLQKREEASLTMAVTVPKGRMLNAPDSFTVVGPNSILILSAFFLLGLFIPVFVIFVRDMINTTINSRGLIEKLTDVSVLSELGHNESIETVIDHSSNVDSNAELFRLLRTKLQFALDYPKQKVIMVTSTEPGEGKSYVSINLAISLSMTGKSVILLGLDLRKPQLKKHLNIVNDEGMSAYLSGHETDYKKLIQSVTDYPRLSVIHAGIIPPNPNELLMNRRLDDLIVELCKEFDYIVIDTAPVGAVSDTFLIDRVCDISLYIVRMDYSDKRNLEYLNHVKKDKTLKRPFIVLNDMNMQSKYYYHRGYSYGYGKYYSGNQKMK